MHVLLAKGRNTCEQQDMVHYQVAEKNIMRRFGSRNLIFSRLCIFSQRYGAMLFKIASRTASNVASTVTSGDVLCLIAVSGSFKP